MAAKARAVKARTITVLEDVDQGETKALAAETKGIPLFEGLEGEVQIEVYRLEPIEEGTIGTLAADADEATIRRRWGGGVYKVTAKGTNGQFTRRQRTVTIGGDPRFESKDAIRRYRIKNGEIQDDSKSAAPAAAAPSGFGMSEILALLQTSHTQQLSFMQAQVNAAALAAEQRAQASQKMAEEARARDQQFLATMMGIVKSESKAAAPAADPMAMMTVLLKGLELGRDMGGGDQDPVAAFIANLPQILPQAQALLASGQQQAAPAAAAPVPANQQQPTGPRIVLSGSIAEQLQKTVAALQAKGYDAEKALAVALQQLAQVPNAPTKPNPAPAAAAAAAPAKAKAAAGGNGTSTPARATRRK